MSFRFRPPAVALTPELRWVLLRAFAPRSAPAPPGVDLADATHLAARLGLAARIGSRPRAATELAGAPEAAAELARACRVAAVAMLQATEAAAEVAAAASAAGASCCFLKGVALELSGALAPGSRVVGDVDVLVPEGAAPAVVDALVARGYAPRAGEDYPHHLPPLLHPRLGLVEVHRHLPGVSLPGPGSGAFFATFGGLAAAGLLVQSPQLGGAAWLPSPPALVAHALAHALLQHGFRPDAYPTVRLLGDLVDLGIGGPEGETLLAASSALLAERAAEGEARAALDACRALVAGQLEWIAGDTPAALLVRHLIAGAVDSRYGEALKLRDLVQPLYDGPRWAGWWRAGRQALALSDAQLDRVYGKPRSRWGYVGRRLLRPLDLLWRAGRAARSAIPTRRGPGVS
jgi:hypothetical protein